MIILPERAEERARPAGLAAWLAAGLGSGWLPKAPGTWGSLAALAPGVWLLEAGGQAALALAVLIVSAAGCAVCARVLRRGDAGGDDPGWIVIDEWAGLWLCLLVASFSGTDGAALWFAAFTAFRLFDILKPWPVSLCERRGPAWWRIMADDLMAGLLAGGVIWAVWRASAVAGGG